MTVETADTDPICEVLIVDDDADCRNVSRLALAKLGVSVHEASDGAEALKRLEWLRPSLIISDVRMPNMNGYELLNKIRRGDPEISGIPFVMMTGLDDAELALAAEKLGVDGFLTKPINVKQFRAKVQGILDAATEKPEKATDTVRQRASPSKRTDSTFSLEQVAEKIEAASSAGASIGQVIRLGIEEIRERIGGEHWAKHQDSVAKVMKDAAEAVCRSNDLYLHCEDGSILIVFGDDNVTHAQAAAASAAKKVNEALFGTDDVGGVQISTIMHSAGQAEGQPGQSATEILNVLKKKATSFVIGKDSEAQGHSGNRGGVSAKADGAQKRKLGEIPSFRKELFERLSAEDAQPIQFLFVPIWNIRQRMVNMYSCLPARTLAHERGLRWGYDVLDQSDSQSEITGLDIACLEFGLLEVIRGLEQGTPAHICTGFHFETLANKNNREKLMSLLSEIPTNLLRYLYPVITNVPSGVPEGRLAEITARLRSMTNFIAVEVFPDLEGAEVLRTISRMRGGGIECIMIRIADDSDTKSLLVAMQVAEKVRQLGGKVGVSGIRSRSALMQLAYSSLDFCTGKSIGGPYEVPPAPFSLDAKLLEQLGAG